MKKFVMMLMLAVFSLGAYAQTQQGQSAVGFTSVMDSIRRMPR